MLTARYKEFFGRVADVPARLLARAGVHPSTVTLFGLFLVFLSCAYLLLSENVLSFCVIVFCVSLLDALDGAVARVGGKVSKFGSYLDAMCDRLEESVIAISVAYISGYWVESAVLVAGVLLISYAKARAAMEVAVSNTEWPDLMERTERGVIYVCGLAASQVFFRVSPLGRDLFWWTLTVLNVLVYITVIQRVLRARSIIKSRS